MGMTSLFERLEGVDAERARLADLEIEQFGSQHNDPHAASKESESPQQEAVFNVDEVFQLAKQSLDFLGALAAPLNFVFCFPPVFISVWIWLLDQVSLVRAFPQLALGLPRGFGKTTVIKLFILYCILFTNKKFILVISATASLAENVIADVSAFLDEPNIIKVFGNWRLGMIQDTQARKRFGFRGRNIVLQGIGQGTSIRGVNVHNERPDLMIFEDIQTKEDAESEQVSMQIETWMLSTAMKAKSPTGCMFLFIANMYPTKWSLLRRLKANPNWVKFIAGGILADGSSLWEDLQPIEQLHREFENDLAAGHPEIFFSEVLNDENAAANNLLDFSKLPEYLWPNDQLPEGNYVIIDPSGWKKKSDEVAVGYFEVIATKPVLRKLSSERSNPADTIRTAIKFCLENNCRLVAIESVAYQATLAYWFRFICEQLGIIGITCVEIYPGTISKNSRILSMFKDYQKGEILVHPELRAEVHGQMVSFNPLKSDNSDDILDLLTYSPKVLAEFGEHVVNLGEIREQEFDSAGILENNCVYEEA